MPYMKNMPYKKEERTNTVIKTYKLNSSMWVESAVFTQYCQNFMTNHRGINSIQIISSPIIYNFNIYNLINMSGVFQTHFPTIISPVFLYFKSLATQGW